LLKMQLNKHIKKLFLATSFVLAMQVVFAAFTFTGNKNSRESSNKYSLKYYNSLSKKGVSITSTRFLLRMKLADLNMVPSTLQNTYHLELTKGNTTFIYPNKLKVKVSKFKTPSAPIY
jgi:hypothetical protein